ncbi:MAG: hypothetical protein PHD37_12440 [Gallionellaceae bacterium]|nr:hypothetical protein [Gallionellaceae bacterium]
MKSILLCMLLTIGVARAEQPELERPRQVPTLRAVEAVVPVHNNARPHTSSARKAEITRRMFWLALSLR